jgi:hypothetical protein
VSAASKHGGQSKSPSNPGTATDSLTPHPRTDGSGQCCTHSFSFAALAFSALRIDARKAIASLCAGSRLSTASRLAAASPYSFCATNDCVGGRGPSAGTLRTCARARVPFRPHFAPSAHLCLEVVRLNVVGLDV